MKCKHLCGEKQTPISSVFPIRSLHMANLPSAAIHLQLIHTNPEPSKSPSSLLKLMNLFGISNTVDSNWVENLPMHLCVKKH